MPQDPAEILPGLLLGSKTAASDVDVLSAHSVTHVLNTTVEIPNFHEKRPGAPKYLNLGLQDTKDDDIAAEFERCRDFINSARDSGGVVLVHCQAGISRSATIVISYLMAEKKMSLLEAYRHTKERRSNVGPNERYCEDLGKFEDSLRPERAGQPRRASEASRQLSLFATATSRNCLRWASIGRKRSGLWNSAEGGSNSRLTSV
eukprot:TRINITY_DN14630_c0_g1_i8.p1 TRINITY_DN14630_c0_g1~~TRINITY_DN14630_c0_g1_i8.p1  ORF type:complete len:204 (+),score=30.70 TRINITY_DN14630_c0_g1_i8:64-675(+)